MMDNLVSIILPTYNRAHVLPYAIKSVLKQSHQNFELIIVDDNSPDNTHDIVKSFDDERIKYIKNEPNLKLPRALNKGFAASKGKYLTWTSDDNMYGEQAIEKMVEVLSKQRCGFVYADYFEFEDLDEKTAEPLNARHETLPEKQALGKANRVGACFMYTREVYEAVGDYDPELFLVEDYDYFMRIANQFEFYHIPEPMYFFRRHEDALYCSRFSEVKSSDVLVRFKNRLINKEDALNYVVNLLMSNIHNLNSPFFRSIYHFVQKKSYRLTVFFNRSLKKTLLNKLEKPIFDLLEDYESEKTDFASSRDTLNKMMNKIAKIEYR